MRCAGWALLIFILSACGGGAGGGASSITAPVPATNAPAGPPAASGPTIIADTTGRVGLFQEFDRLETPAQIQSDAPHYDAVWGASNAQIWDAAHPGMIVSRYFIPQEDRSELSGHDLAWFQSNHPDWILYACRADGTPTHDFAFWGGVGRPDVPLDFHNPAVIDYQVRQINGGYAATHGYNALAIDQVIFEDAMVGGNPNFGQTVTPGEYACGIWSGATFVRRYNGVNDPAWTADMLAFVKGARTLLSTDATLAPHHMKILVNHPLGSLNDPNEQALLGMIDGLVDERGYGDYGRYATPADANIFHSTTAYLSAVQKRGIAVFIINYFADAAVTPAQREYTVAAYFMVNEGGADLFITPNVGASQEDFPEYSASLGKPCAEYSGGPHIYMRKYSGGLVVLNAGSLPAPAEDAALPANHTYRDIDGRPVTNPLSIASNDGYVLTTSNGCS